MKIYLAGPISGRGYDEVVSMYATKISFLTEQGYECLCPMTGKQYLRNEIEFKASGYDKYPVSANHAIVERDRWMVMQSDIVLADLSNSGDRVSIGTMMELAWAHHMGKHTIGIIPEGNVHNHAFVLEACDIVFKTSQEAYKYLEDLANGLTEE
jgi:nucleoside 2-deoxyribosyltransferase